MNNTIFSAFTLTALLGAGMATAAPQPENRPEPPKKQAHAKMRHQAGGLPHGLERLNLNDAQKQQIKRIMEQHRADKPVKQPESRVAFEQKMQQRQQREQQLLSAAAFDEQAARAMIAERRQEREQAEAALVERELNMLKTRHAVLQVLTPDQQQQYWQQRNQRREFREMKQR